MYAANSGEVHFAIRGLNEHLVIPGWVCPFRAVMPIAEVTKLVRMWSAMAYPTAFFEKQSSAVARYSRPSQLSITIDITNECGYGPLSSEVLPDEVW